MKNSKLYTIGYGSRTAADLFHALKQVNVELLVDIRSVPYSRFRPAFNRNRLSILAMEEGLTYVFKGDELGAKLNGGFPSYQELRSRPPYAEGLAYLASLLEAKRTVAIMCCEADYLSCHRYGLVGEDMFRLGYEVIHIGKLGELVPHEGLTL